MFRESFTAEFAATVLLHVGFISALIGVLFFTYGAYIEKQVTTTQVTNVVNGYFGSLPLFTTPAQRARLGAAVAAVQPPDMSAADAQVAAANRALLVKAAAALGGALAACTAGAFAFYQAVDPNYIKSVVVQALQHYATYG
jgi:hypothetical protein